MLSRIVSCQGTAQLAGAVAAMRSNAANGVQYQDHLVIHDLSAPGDQLREFREIIKNLGEFLHPWQSISTLDQFFSKNISADELWINCYPSPGRDRLAYHFNKSKICCFGDALGLNFTQNYWQPEPEKAGLTLKRRLYNLLRKYLNQNPQPKTWQGSIDQWFLLMGGLFDLPEPPGTKRIEAADFSGVFQDIGKFFLKYCDHGRLDQLASFINNNSKIIILMTSNFSETGRMDESDEAREYLKIASAAVPHGAGVLLKPHPRDSRAKIRTIQGFFKDAGISQITLDSPVDFYLPIEGIYSAFETRLYKNLSLICFSSACVGFARIFGIDALVGFGDAVVEKSFTSSWKKLRKRHEKDLIYAKKLALKKYRETALSFEKIEKGE